MFTYVELILLRQKNFFSEKLTLDVPWKNVYTQPTKVTIDGIYLLVVPKIGLKNLFIS
jgi:hypothetical protein